MEKCSETKRTLRVVRRACVDHQPRVDAALLGQRLLERAPGIVVADHADEDAARAERDQIARDIAGAADHLLRCA